MKRTCSKCKIEKEANSFYKTHYWCKPCLIENKKEWRRKDKNGSKEYFKYLKRHFDKYKARQKVKNALARNKLLRADCEECGLKLKKEGRMYNIFAHHPDHSKPLWIIWLCRLCHTKAHNIPNGLLLEKRKI